MSGFQFRPIWRLARKDSEASTVRIECADLDEAKRFAQAMYLGYHSDQFQGEEPEGIAIFDEHGDQLAYWTEGAGK